MEKANGATTIISHYVRRTPISVYVIEHSYKVSIAVFAWHRNLDMTSTTHIGWQAIYMACGFYGTGDLYWAGVNHLAENRT